MPEFKIGNTPLLELQLSESLCVQNNRFYLKLESFNFAGSTKDRVALQMIEDAMRNGLIKNGDTIIEPTSGNTGIGLAAIAQAKGYKCIIVMPDNMSVQRQQLIKKYDAEFVLTDSKLGMQGAIDKANQLHEDIKNSWIAGQFENPSNWKAHYNTTGPEIYTQMIADIDAFVCGIGTGGTITGVGRYLKEKNSDIKIIGVEPSASAVLSGQPPGAHKIQGIGAGFIPKVLDTNIYDEIIKVSDDDAIRYFKFLNDEENVSAGISSGAALCGAIDFAKRNTWAKRIVILCADGKDRYI